MIEQLNYTTGGEEEWEDRGKTRKLAVYGYDATHPHAAASLGSNAYTYDANGNQVTRSVVEGIFNLEYDAENHLVGMAPEGGLRMQMNAEPTESPTIEPTLTQTVEPASTGTSSEKPTVTETATPTEIPSETAQAVQPEAVGETPAETPVETPTEGTTATPQGGAQTATLQGGAQTATLEPPATQTAEPLISLTPTPLPIPSEELLGTLSGERGAEMLTSEVESLESAVYVYDGDGTIVKAIINGVITYYPGRHYNLSMDGETQSIRPTRSATTPDGGANPATRPTGY